MVILFILASWCYFLYPFIYWSAEKLHPCPGPGTQVCINRSVQASLEYADSVSLESISRSREAIWISIPEKEQVCSVLFSVCWEASVINTIPFLPAPIRAPFPAYSRGHLLVFVFSNSCSRWGEVISHCGLLHHCWTCNQTKPSRPFVFPLWRSVLFLFFQIICPLLDRITCFLKFYFLIPYILDVLALWETNGWQIFSPLCSWLCTLLIVCCMEAFCSNIIPCVRYNFFFLCLWIL